jgi:hypothetical protein
MANTFITPSLIASRGLATLYNSTVLAGLVSRDYDSDFTGSQGDTVTVRKPAVFAAEAFDRSAGITVQNATEGSDTIVLNTIANVSFLVVDEDMTLEVDDFQGRLLAPAMEAINQKVDGDLAEALVDAAEGVGGGGSVTWTSSKPNTVLTGETGAKAKLGRAKLPTTERYAVFSPEAAGVCLSDDLFVRADASGSTQGLREASLGRLFGFDTYESQVLGSTNNDAGQADGVAFHRSAVTLASRPLMKPRGVADSQSAVESFRSLGLRVVYSYNNTYKQDEVSVDMLYGVKALRPAGAVELDFGIGS